MSEDVRGREATHPMIVLPWSLVMHSNHRLMPVIRWVQRVPKAAVITAPEYRQAKESAELSIKRQWKGREMVKCPLALTARCFFPDRRKRDAVGYAKLIDDAMTGIVYEDDSQLYRETWERSGIDKANPRIELIITELWGE